MKTWKTYLVVVTVLLSAAAILSVMFAEPVWAQVRAALVRDADNPDRQAVLNVSGDFDIADGVSQSAECVTVPSGKRWVMEYFSARTAVGATQVVENKLGVGVEHYFSPTRIGGPFSMGYYFVTSSPVLIRASAGESVCVATSRGTDNDGVARTWYRISGYELDYP